MKKIFCFISIFFLSASVFFADDIFSFGKAPGGIRPNFSNGGISSDDGKSKNDSKRNSKSESKNSKSMYFDPILEGTLFVYEHYEYNGYRETAEHSAAGDFTFSFPVPFVKVFKEKIPFEFGRFNIGSRGCYAQFLGVGFSGKKFDFIIYPFGCGLGGYWMYLDMSVLDLRCSFKMSKHFNLEASARPLRLSGENAFFEPEFSLGLRFPIYF